jgi:hypothetical protein
MLRFITLAMAILACLTVLDRRSKAADGPATKPSKPDAERARWESKIQFFGIEATGEWSLRIHDADVDTKRQFRLRELWTYNRQSKRWERMTTDVLASWMLPPGQKKAEPGEEADPDPTQTLADLPIDKDQVGLYYAKWSVDDARGATFCRIGTGLEKKSDYMHKPAPEGRIWVVLPIDVNHSIPAYIPMPEVACKSKSE